MSTALLVLFSIAIASYLFTVACVVQLVGQVNQGSPQHKVSIWTWPRGWKIHKTLFPASSLRTRLLVGMSVTVGLGLLVFIIKAGTGWQSTNDDQALTLPSGSVIKIRQVWQLNVFQEPPALRLDYQTNLKIADNSALRSEADEVWSVFFRNKVEEGHFTKAVITAHEPSKGWSLLRARDAYMFTYTKQADGGWSLSERQK